MLWAADLEFFRPLSVEKEATSSFTASGQVPAGGMAALVGELSRRDPRIDFASAGATSRATSGARGFWRRRSTLARAISAARVNLNMTRRAHATVEGSSTCRLFELASAGAAIVSNLHVGLERWFEPGRELLRRRDADGALEAYHALLDDPGEAAAMGARARERVLDEHTYAHRARQMLRLLELEVVVPV